MEVQAMGNKVILYTTHCPMCKALRMKLDKNGIQYDICEDVDLMLSKGFKHMPVLEVNGQTLNTKEAMRWAEENKCI